MDILLEKILWIRTHDLLTPVVFASLRLITSPYWQPLTSTLGIQADTLPRASTSNIVGCAPTIYAILRQHL